MPRQATQAAAGACLIFPTNFRIGGEIPPAYPHPAPGATPPLECLRMVGGPPLSPAEEIFGNLTSASCHQIKYGLWDGALTPRVRESRLCLGMHSWGACGSLKSYRMMMRSPIRASPCVTRALKLLGGRGLLRFGLAPSRRPRCTRLTAQRRTKLRLTYRWAAPVTRNGVASAGLIEGQQHCDRARALIEVAEMTADSPRYATNSTFDRASDIGARSGAGCRS